MHANCDSASVSAEMRVLLAGSHQKPLLNARRSHCGVHLPSSVQRRLAIHRLRAVAQPAFVDPTSMESGSSTDGAMVLNTVTPGKLCLLLFGNSSHEHPKVIAAQTGGQRRPTVICSRAQCPRRRLGRSASSGRTHPMTAGAWWWRSSIPASIPAPRDCRPPRTASPR